MSIFDTSIVSLDGKACEEIELTGSRLADFTTVRRPDMNQPKLKYSHTTARTYWVRRVQRADPASLQSPGWKLVEDEDTGVLKCESTVKGYRPMHVPGGPLAEKLVAHVHDHICILVLLVQWQV